MLIQFGSLISQYDIHKRLGASHVSRTYLIKTADKTKHCLKIILKQEKFSISEGKITEIQRKNTDPLHLSLVYQIYEDPYVYATFSDYYKGESLDTYFLKDTPYNEAVFSGIIKQILWGLKTLHGRKMLHRNLKPTNILLIKDETKLQVRLMDYNLQSLTDKNAKLSDLYLESGYASPEFFLQQPCDEASDVWSLGVLMFYLFTGRRLFPYDDNKNIHMEMMERRLVFPEDSWPLLTRDAQDLVQNMLQFEPDNRIHIQDALKHRWIIRKNLPTKELVEARKNFITTALARKLQSSMGAAKTAKTFGKCINFHQQKEKMNMSPSTNADISLIPPDTF